MKNIFSAISVLVLAVSGWCQGFHYISGPGTHTILFGRFEVRMKIVEGSGLCNAMCPIRDIGDASNLNGDWTECDIEILGDDPWIVETCAHAKHNLAYQYRRYAWQVSGYRDSPEDGYFDFTSFGQDYHTYTIEWGPDHVYWGLDGIIFRKAFLEGNRVHDITYLLPLCDTPERDTIYNDNWLEFWSTRPMRFAFDVWNTAANGFPDWAGPWDPANNQKAVFYSWFKFYEYRKGAGDFPGYDFKLVDYDDFLESGYTANWSSIYSGNLLRDGKCVGRLGSGWNGIVPPDPGDTGASRPTIFPAFIPEPPPVQYTVSVTAGAHGSVSPNGDQTVEDGQNLGISATANVGYIFTYWAVTGGLSIENDSSGTTNLLNITGNGTVTANFELEPVPEPILCTLSVVAGANGSVSPNGVQIVELGQNLNISATANTGYVFDNWTVTGGLGIGNTDSSSTTIANITGNGSVTANFELIPIIIPEPVLCSLSVLAGTNGSVSPGGIQIVEQGDSLSISAFADSGYVFTGWTVSDGLVIGNDSVVTNIIITCNGTVTADFEPETRPMAPPIPPVGINNEMFRNITETGLQYHGGTISYSVKEPCRITMRLYDLSGKLVRTFVDGWKPYGYYKLESGEVSIPAGVHVIIMQTPEKKIVRIIPGPTGL